MFAYTHLTIRFNLTKIGRKIITQSCKIASASVMYNLVMKLFVGAKALIINSEGKVLIVRESSKYDDGVHAGEWDLVGGRIEAEEFILDGLKREVGEESGLEIEVLSVLGVSDNFPEIKGEKVHIVRVTYLCQSFSDAVVLSDDHDAYEWIDPADHAQYNIIPDVAEIIGKYNSPKQ